MSNELLKQNMWVAAGGVFTRSAAILLAISSVILAATIYGDTTEGSSGTFVGELIAWSGIAYVAHSMLLQNTSGMSGTTNNKPFFRFIWRTGVLTLLPVLLVIPVFFTASSAENNSKEVLVLAALILISPLYLVVFGLFGTCLPAVVMDEGYKIGRTFRRGIRTFLPTIGRLIVGPGLLMSLVIGIAIFYPFYSGDGRVLSETYHFEPANLIPYVAFTLIGVFTTVLTATILSKAYVSGEAKLGPGEHSASATSSKRQEPILSDPNEQTGN